MIIILSDNRMIDIRLNCYAVQGEYYNNISFGISFKMSELLKMTVVDIPHIIFYNAKIIIIFLVTLYILNKAIYLPEKVIGPKSIT